MEKVLTRAMFAIAMYACLSLLPACEDQTGEPPSKPVQPQPPSAGVLYRWIDHSYVKGNPTYAVVGSEKDSDNKIWVKFLKNKDDHKYTIEDVQYILVGQSLFNSLYEPVSGELDENQQAAFDILQQAALPASPKEQ